MTDSADRSMTLPAERRDEMGMADRFARSILRSALRRLCEGRVTLIDGSSEETFGSRSRAALHATITVHRSAFYRKVAFGGSLGAAEAYTRAWWSCDDLPTLFRIFARNISLADDMESGLASVAAWFARAGHRLRSNTRIGSRRNIHAHYDLGNDFFSLFLDPTMTYSCGIFERKDSSLEDASIAKLDRICRKLDLRPDDYVVEIGSGWGSFALYAAANYGCHITTTTISEEQCALVRRRVREARLADRITVLLQDYRDVQGVYDKLVSIEMIEAVGHEFLDTYFAKCSELLKPDGAMLIQAITMPDHRYERYRRSVDFIQEYVFPGSCVPSQAAMSGSVARASDLRCVHLEDLTPHYATTLRLWRERFLSQLSRVREQGYSEEFIRTWEYYLAYCEGGFRERYTGSVQLLYAKPRCRRAPLLPPLELGRSTREVTRGVPVH